MAVITTSGGYSYTQTAGRMISGALRLCGVIGDEETPTAPMAENALDTLNAMVKGWQASGIHVWCEEECILFLQPQQAQYQLGANSPDHACDFRSFTQAQLAVTGMAGDMAVTVASQANLLMGDTIGIQLDGGTNFWTTISGMPVSNVVPLAAALPSQATSGALAFDYTSPLVRPLRVPEGRRYQYLSRISTPLVVLSRTDYDFLPNLYGTGVPTQFFYDPQQGEGAYATPTALFNVWPVPGDNTNAIRFISQRPIQDITTLATIPDFPAEWLAALRWNLAVEMAPEFDVPADRFDRLQAKAQEWFQRAAAWDKEPEPFLFGVSFGPSAR